MKLRRFLPFLMLLALALAPFGRMAAAEAKAMPHHATMAMSGHCTGQPQPDRDRHPASIDCMIACAAMAPAAAPDFAPPPTAHAEPASAPALILAGILPEAEPPPPRLS